MQRGVVERWHLGDEAMGGAPGGPRHASCPGAGRCCGMGPPCPQLPQSISSCRGQGRRWAMLQQHPPNQQDTRLLFPLLLGSGPAPLPLQLLPFFPAWEEIFNAEGGCRSKGAACSKSCPSSWPSQILHSLFSFSDQEGKRAGSKTRHRERKRWFTPASKTNYAARYASHPFPSPVPGRQWGNLTFPRAQPSHPTAPRAASSPGTELAHLHPPSGN